MLRVQANIQVAYTYIVVSALNVRRLQLTVSHDVCVELFRLENFIHSILDFFSESTYQIKSSTDARQPFCKAITVERTCISLIMSCINTVPSADVTTYFFLALT